MHQITTIRTKTATKEPGATSASLSLSPETRRALRTLGDFALRLADDELPNGDWLNQQVATAKAQNDDNGRSTQGPLLTIPEAYARLRISRWSLYDLIHKRQLLSVKIGRRRFIPSSELSRYVSSLPLDGGQLL